MGDASSSETIYVTATGRIGTISAAGWQMRRMLQKVSGPTTLLNLRTRSLARGNTFVFGSMLVVWGTLRTPDGICAKLLPVALLLTLLGTVDTVRSLQRRWNFYHAGVLLLLYTDLMAIMLLLFLSVAPFLFSSSFGK